MKTSISTNIIIIDNKTTGGAGSSDIEASLVCCTCATFTLLFETF